MKVDEVARSEFERRIMALLKAGKIKVGEAAEMLGVHRSTVTRRCKALGVDPREAREARLRRLVKLAPRIGRLPWVIADLEARARRVREQQDGA